MTAPAAFSLRIVSVDSHMTKPAQGLDSVRMEMSDAPLQKAPIIRIFGATPAGNLMFIESTF